MKAALHVPHDALFYDSDGMGAQYTYGSRDQRPWYKTVVPSDKLRILIYSGDVDTCVNTLWSEWWTSELGGSIQYAVSLRARVWLSLPDPDQAWTMCAGLAETESWRGWTMDNETAMAGYVTRYEHSFDFLTVRHRLACHLQWHSGSPVASLVPPADASRSSLLCRALCQVKRFLSVRVCRCCCVATPS